MVALSTIVQLSLIQQLGIAPADQRPCKLAGNDYLCRAISAKLTRKVVPATNRRLADARTP